MKHGSMLVLLLMMMVAVTVHLKSALFTSPCESVQQLRNVNTSIQEVFALSQSGRTAI